MRSSYEMVLRTLYFRLCPVFGDLPANALKELAQRTKLRWLKPDEVLLEEQARPGSVFLLTEGSLLVCRGSKQNIVARIQPFNLVGEMEALGPESTLNAATVKARGNAGADDWGGAVVLEVWREDFVDFLHRHPDAMRALNKWVAGKIIATEQVASGTYSTSHRLLTNLDALDRFRDIILTMADTRRSREKQHSVWETQKKYTVECDIGMLRSWAEEEQIDLERQDVEQFYLNSHDLEAEIRVRSIAERRHISVARVRTGGHRARLECPISQGNYETLRDFVSGNIIKKTRYSMKYRGNNLRLDVFDSEGALAGLMLLEVTTSKADEEPGIPGPIKVNEDVTNSDAHSNRALAGLRHDTN